MKKLIFCKSNFLGSGHFLIPEILDNDQKLTGAKKVKILKNQLLHPCQLAKVFLNFVNALALFS